MKSKVLQIGAAVLILVAICAAIGYHLSYPIESNMETLPQHILDYYNQGRSPGEGSLVVKLFDKVHIGREEYYLVEVGENLGSVTLVKGLTGRYKITHLGYGDGNFLDGVIENSGQKYLIFGGRDVASQISKITVSIAGQTYELQADAKDHFLLCTEINSHVEDNHVDRNSMGPV